MVKKDELFQQGADRSKVAKSDQKGPKRAFFRTFRLCPLVLKNRDILEFLLY